jgi:peptide/nickel transport system ATP-binding protein
MRDPMSEQLQELAPPLVDVRGLAKVFWQSRGLFGRTGRAAVDDVCFSIDHGRVLALVGESGSGKTTTAWMLARLMEPTRGRIQVGGKAAPLRRDQGGLRQYRRQVQMIFQDPFAALNPIHDVRHHLIRPMLDLGAVESAAAARARAAQLLETVGLEPARDFLEKLPHQLSGGQRQRVMIARALGVGPQVLLADEPTSMLDVSIRMGVLNLLKDLVRDQRLGMLFITHDLASARYMAHEIAVMYAGRIVEHGSATQVVTAPQHPYTELLLSSVFTRERRGLLRQEPAPPAASSAAAGAGCAFAPRCRFAFDRCRQEAPPPLPAGGNLVRCWLHEQPAPGGLPAKGQGGRP